MNASSEIRDLMEAEVNQITGGSREPEGGVNLPGFFLIWGPNFLAGTIGPCTFIINDTAAAGACGF